MHKDIALGDELGKKYGVPLPMNEFIRKAYEAGMERYGKDSGSSIPLTSSSSMCSFFWI